MNEAKPEDILIGLARANDRLERLQESIGELKKDLSPRTKDSWDKAGVLAQFLSGAVIGAIVYFR